MLLFPSGSHVGGTDILSWTETQVAALRVTGVDSSRRSYVTITAINMPGLYATQTFIAEYVPSV